MNQKCFGKCLSFLKADLVKPKVSTLLTLGLVAFASAQGFAQSIRLEAKNQQVESVLNQIEKQSGYSFIYDASILSNNKLLTLYLSDDELSIALNKLAKQLNVEYTIVNKTITLTPLKKLQATIKLSGTVLLNDLDGKSAYPNAGISVLVKNYGRGTTTNNRGEYTLEVPANSTLEVSYLGYKKQEVAVSTLQSNTNIVLQKSMDYIDEVIVTAYGTKESRENQTGSAYVVTAKDLANKPALRLDALLEGIVPGVEFNSQDAGSNSSARTRYSTRIRGDASTTGGATSNEPLWVVDGVPLYTGGTTNMIPGMQVSISPLTYLDVNDIESVTVLKDASATTIYGANGSNGVILITTKKGKGDPKLTYSLRYGTQSRPNLRLNLLDGPQYLDLIKQMGLVDKLGKLDTTVNTQWGDLYFQRGQNLMHTLNLSGSTTAVNYFLSANMYDDRSIVIGNTTKRYAVRSNINGNIGKHITVQSGLYAAFSKNKLFNPGDSYFQYSALINPFGPNGEYIERDPNGNLLQNMPGLRDQNDNKQQSFNVIGNIGFTVNLFEGLKFINRNGLDFSSGVEDQYNSMNNYTGVEAKGKAYRGESQVMNAISNNMMTYERKIGKGDLDILVGTEARIMERHSVSATGSNFPNDYIREVGFVAVVNRIGTTSRAKETLLSYLGRAGYVYDKRYALNYTYRKDGSSNFGKDVKWGIFNSIGAAWTVSNEAFWPKNDIVDFLKFKASYGNNGNSRFSGAYAKGIYNFNTVNSYGGESGAVMTRGINEGLKWESTNMFNGGLDFRLFDRVTVAAEYYKNVTNDLIDNTYASMLTGFRRVYENVGKIQNTGFELAVNSDNIKKDNFNWSSTFILSFNRNKVLQMSDGTDRSVGTKIMREGYNSNSFYLVRWAGVDPSTGDPMWLDANDNVTKVFNSANRVIVGNSTPNFYGGMTNNFSYGNFNFSIFFKYSQGGLMFNDVERRIGLDGLNILNGNQSVNMLNAWRYPGQLATNPRLSNVTTESTLNSTRFLLDRSYLSLENISASYTFRDGWVKQLKLANVTVAAMANKVAFWTPYSTKKGSVNQYAFLTQANNLNHGNVTNGYGNILPEGERLSSYSLSINIGF
ncbi:SusC/RagA family TonB-linked outer membrane protein [Sphingobacterium sp. MYb382]|uniref:SusC/RagA family TonB-linked outer membrane protein n=1 Tax=Sphingobacterium sp. MYb382 TaxID=2745278 RepID=UPI0030B1702E